MNFIYLLIVAAIIYFLLDALFMDVPTNKPRTSDYRHTRDRTKRSEMRSAPR